MLSNMDNDIIWNELSYYQIKMEPTYDTYGRIPTIRLHTMIMKFETCIKDPKQTMVEHPGVLTVKIYDM